MPDPSDPDPIRWGIIGAGDVCEVKSGPGFQKANGSTLAAVMRRTPGAADDFARRHSINSLDQQITPYDDADELISDENVDAVYIASPPGSHKDLAMRVLAAKKPCYVEKPLARNATESKEIVDAFKAAGVPLYVAYYRRAQPRFLKAREIVASGVLGQVTDVRYRKASSHHCNPVGAFAQYGEGGTTNLPWRLIPEQAGGGLLMDVGCHSLDILEWILGSPLNNVTGGADARGAFPHVPAAERVEDVVHLAGSTAEGCLIQCSWNFATPISEDMFVFCGSAGQLELSCFGTDALKLTVMGDASGKNTVIEFPFDKLAHVQQPLIQTIVDELRGVTGTELGSCPSKGDNAIRCAQHMDTVLSEYYGGRDDNFWERPIPFSRTTSLRHRLASE